MHFLRKHKAYAVFADALLHPGRLHQQIEAQLGKHIGGAAFSRYCTVAVFGYGYAGTGGNQGGCGRDIEADPAVPAGAHHIDHLASAAVYESGIAPQHLCGTHQLADTLALHAHGGQQGAGLSIRDLLVHQQPKQLVHLGSLQVAATKNLLQISFQHIHLLSLELSIPCWR